MDGDDRGLSSGEAGEIAVRSPVNRSGSWENPQAIEQLLRGGRLHTGDLAMRDNKGYFWLTGPKKQIAKRNKSWSAPARISLCGKPLCNST
jgi:fatty-acyl-CoA synthase